MICIIYLTTFFCSLIANFTPDWQTYYGSIGVGTPANEFPHFIALDPNGDLYVVGETGSTNFEVRNAPNIPQDFFAGNIDGAIIKFGCNSNLPSSSNSNARIGINEFENIVEEDVLNRPTILIISKRS